MNILGLLQEDGHTTIKVASTRGGEYAGPCPFCGGRDRFRVHPEYREGRYWCRGCGKSGDAISYLREFRGLSFADACKASGMNPRSGTRGEDRKETATAFTPREVNLPPGQWSDSAAEIAGRAVKSLWSPSGGSIRDFLRGRGLREETIRTASIGWNRRTKYVHRAEWGMGEGEHREGKRIWIPAGLVLPLVRNGMIVRLRIRRMDPGDEPRYVIITGSTSAAMVWPGKGRFVVVESELDGLLIHQEAGDLAGVVALGSAQARPDSETHSLLVGAGRILLAHDADEAGAKASRRFWAGTYGQRAVRWPVPIGKDPGDAFVKGLQIRAWIEAGLFLRGRP